MVREVILLSEALYTTLRRAEIWWGVIDIRWTKWEQAKMLTDPSLSTQFFSGFSLSEKPLCDFHVPHNAICFPTKLCIRIVFSFLMDDC